MISGDEKCRGIIHITAEGVSDMKSARSTVSCHIGASKLDKKGVLSTKKVHSFVLPGSTSVQDLLGLPTLFHAALSKHCFGLFSSVR